MKTALAHRDHDEQYRSRDRNQRSRENRPEREKGRERDHERRSSRRDHDHSGGRSRDQNRRRADEKDSRRPRRSPSRSRQRSPSVTPLHKRPRRLQNWDVAPPGYEGMSAQEVKATGHFPLPGHTTGLGGTSVHPFGLLAQQAIYGAMDPSKVSQGAAGPAAQNASLARQSRRLYVGNIPYGINEESIADFFNATMLEHNITTGSGNPVVTVQINHDKNYAFVEFKAVEEATAAIVFDGMNFQGQPLKIRRPKDYLPPMGQGGEPLPIHVPGVISTNVPDSPNKIFIGGLPAYLNEEQVIELLKSFGELRAFNLVKDTATGLSKGFGFCEYVDPAITDIACQGLHNMELGDKKLVVQRASIGAKMAAPSFGTLGSFPIPPELIPINTHTSEPTTILQLLNMVTPEELQDDDEYQDILEDVGDECSKFGRIVEFQIPKPINGEKVPGVGKVFIRFETKDECSVALRALAGRKFGDRTVVASYITEERFQAQDY
ncbi:hypothetical protein K493DRAFT_219056 [Basidiobolus meristosporus CBS 931.73]|uniref:Splicing factor U2AF subunit n=1 Tax=Basidiobolus meristosporus CBS 931.73 TaxID=1314790 RepID=A0A1Y1YD32_9FUNG|nr:hypothetical protein K493DRAFT_219056 [Basidiobolus meristosporus CBS 931.73]|eukprot:ORX95524.1 hypothetical protein K493DRAFT_219056 [Basidiobolus meristosporus CBS 931.73]